MSVPVPELAHLFDQPGADFGIDDEEPSLDDDPLTAAHAAGWLLDAADLLAEPDPGPTPMLVEDLVVDGALIAAVGRWKTTKSYGLLDVCISVATGRPAFGRLAIPTPGPVVFVNEESGRAALWRRLDALCRGRAIDPEELRGQLHVAANAGIRLDDLSWQKNLLDLSAELRPRLFVFDPLVRMKSPLRDENAQNQMAVLVDFLRDLREKTKAAVCFVHHEGHSGGNMRGSSDLESFWETRLTWKRDGQSRKVELSAEHREAEASQPLTYRIGWDATTRSMRFDADADPAAPTLADRIVDYLAEHVHQKTDEVAKGIGIRRTDVLRTLEELEHAGTIHNGPSGRTDALGRPIRDKVWSLSTQAEDSPSQLWDDPDSPTDPDTVARPTVPPSLEGDGTDEPPTPPPSLSGEPSASRQDAARGDEL